MKVFISVDLEGISGVCLEAQTAMGTPQYTEACELMRDDLDAALEGCLTAGATEIVICDAHALGANLTCRGLPPQARLASGSPADLGMMHGLDDTFAAAVFIGYHAMAGTKTGVLEHTYTYDVFRVRIDEHLEVGETGVNAGIAGRFGVPVVFVSGDAATAKEALELLPGVGTAVVKHGTSRTAARLLPPEVTRPLIRDGVAEALLAADPPAPVDFAGLPLRLTLINTRRCDAAALCPGTERVDGRTLQIAGGDFLQTFFALETCLELAAAARE
ncbi:MAG TPA: M55 family metallopeptidase [Thermoleophilia bacterium]|nr:M55 family metallopeptidase [Thermoleophilia bacterium]